MANQIFLQMQLNLQIKLTVNLLTFLTVREIATRTLRQMKLSHQGAESSGGSAAAGSTSLEKLWTIETYQTQEWQVPGPQARYPSSNCSS